MIAIMKHSRMMVLLTAAALLAACSAPDTGKLSYQDAHPIRVVEEIVNIGLSVPGANGRVVPSEEPGLVRFARIFHLRAKTPITLYVDEAKGDGVDRQGIVVRTKSALRRAGISEDSVRVMPGSLGHDGPAPVLMTFDAHDVEAPECGDWSSGSTFNWSNAPHSDFGCSYQRNLALSVANPGEFVASEPMTAFGAARGIVNVLALERGESFGPASSAAE